MKKIYVVTMIRFSGQHSYVHGIFNKKSSALKEAESERMYRGGNKYYPEVAEFELDNITSRKIILNCDVYNHVFMKKYLKKQEHVLCKSVAKSTNSRRLETTKVK